MKKILLLFLFCTIALAQNSGKVAQNIENLVKQNVRFESQSLFSEPTFDNSNSYSGVVENATFVTLKDATSSKIIESSSEHLELIIPYQNETIKVLLYKVVLHSPTFHVDSNQAKMLTYESGVHYRGIIKNDPNSLVSFNIFKNEINGIVSNGRLGNLTIAKLQKQNSDRNYIIYSDKNLKISNTATCNASKILPNLLPETNTLSNPLTQNCVTTYFELDYEIYLANGSSIVQTTNWMNSVFNNVQTLYSNDAITIALNSIFIWTTPDPYTGTTVLDYLYQFQQVRPVFDGDVGKLLTIGTGFGGVAAVVGGLCSENNFGYSDIYFSFSNVPIFSWTVQTIAHELGHLLGSPHTHDCVWNGNNTPIDGCGPSAGYPGLTVSGQTCSTTTSNPTNGGTIMSYCYIIGEIGNNFANGFGSQPAARISQYVNAATCLGSDCITTCISMITNFAVSEIGSNSATLTWNDLDLSNSSWQISATSYPFVPTIWTTVSQQPFLINNLNPNTYYKFFIRNNCGELLGTQRSSAIIATSDDFCSGKPFTDTGGTTQNYDDFQNWTRTVVSNDPNNKIKVTFTSIDIEQDYDFLYIYNGATTTSPELVLGGITGNTIVGPFTSTDPTGALTFKFVSDTNTNGAGWEGIFSCENLDISQNNLIDFSYYPNPVKNEIFISSKNEMTQIQIFSIDGKLLFEENNKKLDSKIDMSKFASGTYLFKVFFGEKAMTFKIIK